MKTRLRKGHVAATALALVAGYGALLSDLVRAPEPPAPEPPLSAAPTAAQPSAALSHNVLARSAAPAAPLPERIEPAADDLSPPEAAPPAEGPEPALARWMLAAIRGEEWDREHTHDVEAELSATLARAPELHAQELECGKRFCRALLVDRRGAAVQLQALFGAPPFDGEGFTTLGEGGQAEIYFTRAGQSLDALRQEASL